MNYFKSKSKITNKRRHHLNRVIGDSVYLLFFTMILIGVILLAGCVSNKKLLNEVGNKIHKAGEYFKTVKELQAGKKYSDYFVTAKQELHRAKDYLSKKRVQKAIQAAEISMIASQQILKRYYLDEIAPQADKLIKEIGKKVSEDTDNPLNQYVPELHAILDFGKDLETDKETALLDDFLNKRDKIATIRRGKDTLNSKKLNADVFFKPGEYNLTTHGKRILDKDVIKKIITNKNRYRVKYPQSTITIKIEVRGYTDQIKFNESKPLFKKLTQSVEAQLPPKNRPKKRRQFLNQRLSELRARSIRNYIDLQFSNYHKSDLNFKIAHETKGMGEILPSGVNPLNSASDPKRRICKIYFYIAHISN